MTQGISIPVDELRTLLGKSIIDGLSEQSKEQVLSASLNYLLEKPEIQDRYASKKEYGPSPIEVALRDAVKQLAREVAKELAEALRPQITTEVAAMLAKIDAMEYNYELKQQLMDTLLTAANAELKDKRGY